MKNLVTRRRATGFSLVELLVVIAVIGIIAAMAVLNVSNVNGNSRVTAAKAQAQRIASTFNAGASAGAASFISCANLSEAMNAVGAGSNGGGINASSFFQVAGISAGMDSGKPDDQKASRYLRWDNGNLIYDPSGTQQQAAPPAPPVNWQPLGAGDIGNLMTQAISATGNSSLTLSQMVAWFNAQPNQPVTLMESNGGVFYSMK